MSSFKAPANGVAVRMYRQGLGDCFLLALPAEKKGESYFILIDCGVIFGTPAAGEKMNQVANDILDATGGNIHLLVITHEHWDHVSGFTQAKAVFDKMQIHNLWFAWTEDPKDPLAKQLRVEFAKAKDALRLAMNRASNPRALSSVKKILGYYGDPASMAAAGGADTTGAMNSAAAMVKKSKGQISYYKPGDGPLEFPKAGTVSAAKGVRTFVLGPPHDLKALKKVNPSTSKPETYSEKSGFALAADRLTMALAGETEAGHFTPFESRLRIPISTIDHNPFFAEFYGSSSGTPNEQDWRRIDDEWLGSTEELALKLDSYTNNTSLVLGLELIKSGKVLLFVADAQVGNWLSWNSLKWQVKDGTKTKEVTTEDLFSRTVLYKVGHHGSHNATMREQGLERMQSADLVAMIPVDEQVAHEIKGWMKMPFEPLLERLGEKTHGRCVRVDKGLPAQRPAQASVAEWKKFTDSIEDTKLYLQFTVTG